MKKNYGFKPSEFEANQYVHGDGRLGAGPLVPDGQWGAYLPIIENQKKGVEPAACVTFAILNCVEILIRQELGVERNFSDRFLAYASGTMPDGNDPHTVAETLRTKGDVNEEEWPYSPDIKTWAEFYQIPPQSLYLAAKLFNTEFNYGHSWVFDLSQEGLMKALTYSPLSASVDAWQKDSDDLYYRVDPTSNHCIVIYGYERNHCWYVFDTYENNLKKLRWDYKFQFVKRHTTHRQVVDEVSWAEFLVIIKRIFGL